MEATSYVAYAERSERKHVYTGKQLLVSFALGAIVSALLCLQFVVQLPISDFSKTFSSDFASTDSCLQADDVPSQLLSHKFSVTGTTPVELQLSRGTCWVFAAVDVLEWAYREQGVAQGWLRPDEYVRMSEQAFGIAVLDACLNLRDDLSCLVGTEVWRGRQLLPMDTQGGSADLLFYLKSLETTAALPWGVCPYTSKVGQDHECPGLEEAKATNPLSFEIRSITWLYERQAVKQRLLQSQRLMAFSTAMVTITYRLPCTNRTKEVLGCDPTDADGMCEACPLEPAFARVKCCILSDRESNSMEGEFFRLPRISHPDPQPEGGHAMALVGFSDVYTTQHGFTGGWILKNSWWDGLPPGEGWQHGRGSHSIAYFMQEVSSADEAHVCPNSHSPQTWSMCTSLNMCRSSATSAFARTSRQPLHLKCIDESPFLHGLCIKDEPLFLKSITPWGGGLSVACFLRDRDDLPFSDEDDDEEEAAVVNGARRRRSRSRALQDQKITDHHGDPRDQRTWCSPPVPIDDLALVVRPVPNETYPNDPDLCGHYFFPYQLAEDVAAATGGFEVSDFDVVWRPQSYAANQDLYPHLDYSLLVSDTHVQSRVTKRVPFLEEQPFPPRPPPPPAASRRR